MLLSSIPVFSGLLGTERWPRVHIPGLRSLSWGVWTCSSQPGNHHPASQERPPQCGTAHALLTSSPNACPETRRQSESRKPSVFWQSIHTRRSRRRADVALGGCSAARTEHAMICSGSR